MSQPNLKTAVDTRDGRAVLYASSSSAWFSADMLASSEFAHLTVTWVDHPTGTACAAVAEGFRKRGSLSDATALAAQCIERWPEFLPGHLVLARIRRDAGELAGAERAIQAALALDPAHPVVLQELATIAELRGQLADSRAWRQLGEAVLESAPSGLSGFLAGPAFPIIEPGMFLADHPIDEEPAEPGEEVLTESLAALYQAQGHLGRAAEVYAALAERTPDNASLADRRDALRDDLAKRNPRPYDARVSGGTPVGVWLKSIALARAVSQRPQGTGYDAFYQTPQTRETPEDFEAFQNWMKGLGR